MKYDDMNTDQLLNACGHAYDAACLYHAKGDAAYENSLKLLMEIVDELSRRSRNDSSSLRNTAQ